MKKLIKLSKTLKPSNLQNIRSQFTLSKLKPSFTQDLSSLFSKRPKGFGNFEKGNKQKKESSPGEGKGEEGSSGNSSYDIKDMFGGNSNKNKPNRFSTTSALMALSFLHFLYQKFSKDELISQLDLTYTDLYKSISDGLVSNIEIHIQKSLGFQEYFIKVFFKDEN